MICMHCGKPILLLKVCWWKRLPLCYKCFKNKQKQEAEREFNLKLKQVGVDLNEN